MHKLRLISACILLVGLLVSACDWDPLGLSSIKADVKLNTSSELGPETLARIDEINKTLASGIEIGPETRDLIREINNTLAQGAKVGLDEATLERIDALLAQLERGIGIEVGLAPDTLASVNRLLDQLDAAPDQWQSVAEELIKALEGSAGNVAKEMASQIKGVLNEARLNLQQLMAAAGTEMRCNVDFLGSRAGATLSEFMGRSIIGQLHDIIEGKSQTAGKAPPIPWVCQMIPDQVSLVVEGTRLVAERPVIILTGYNFMDQNKPEAYLVSESGARIEAVQLFPYRQSSYQIQLNLQGIDFTTVPQRSRVVFKWPNVPDTSALAVLMPAPAITPTAGAEVTITARTSVYAGPGTKYNVLGLADAGAKYAATGRTGDSNWFQIAYDRKSGWVPASAARKNAVDVPVVSLPLPPPTANFKADGPSGPAPLTVEFTDLSSGEPTRWKWEFGDGGTASTQNPAYTYRSAGRYSVKLTVSNSQGSDSKTAADLVVVSAPPPGPVAGFTASPRSGSAPLTVHFYDASSGTPTSWVWTFGDGKTVTERNPTHTYTSPGRYSVSLKVKNAQGENTRTISEYIVVSAVPTTQALPACYEIKTSDEFGPVSCQAGFAVRGMKCQGKYCDNMILNCCPYKVGADSAASFSWSAWFSEESPNKIISADGFVCGLKASGEYSDNLSLQILRSSNLKHVGACSTLSLFSEEQPEGSTCPTNAFVAGVECWGSHCDNLRLVCCPGGK